MVWSLQQLSSASRQLLSWALVLALVLGGMAFMVDGGLLFLEDTSQIMRFTQGALASVSLGVLVAAGVAPAAALLAFLTSRKFWVKAPMPLGGRGLLVGLAFMLCWGVTDPLDRRLPLAYIALVLGSTGLITLCLFLASRPLSWRSSALLLSLAVAAVAGDCWLNATIYPELHMLAHLLAAAGLLALLVPLRQSLYETRLLILILASLGLGGAIYAAFELLERQLPSWPTLLRVHGRHAHRLLIASKAIFRYDPAPPSLPGGFRPSGDLASGGEKKGPGGRFSILAQDVGIGLGPPVGDPAYSRGTADLVLLITVECFRANALTKATMPRLWDYASRGAVFLRGYAASSQTKQSLPALQGKRLVKDIAVGLLDDHSSGNASVAAQLRSAGVTTSAVVGYENTRAGDHWGQILDFETVFSPGLFSAAITDAALGRIREVGPRPHYVWLHYWEPHRWPSVRPKDVNTSSRLKEVSAKDRYSWTLKVLDAQLERLFQKLEQWKMLSRSLVIITGDHGEALGERGLTGHARTGHEVMLRVPMVLIGPGIPAGRLDKLVSHHDILPTVLGAFGVRDKDGLQGGALGRSWLRLRGHPEVIFHHFVVANSYRQVSGQRGLAPMAILATDRYKIHFGWNDEQLELYDLPSDPAETQNLVTEQPLEASRKLKQLISYCKKARCEGAKHASAP